MVANALAWGRFAPSPRRALGSRRFVVALVISMLAHVAFLASTLHVPERTPDFRMPGPMVVELGPAQTPRAPAGPVESAPAPVIHPHPRPPVHRIPRVVRPAPPVVREEIPPVVRAEAPVVPPPPVAAPPAPQVDMLAMINARRERRRRMEEAEEAAAASARPGGGVDEGLAALNRNLRTLSGDDGTGGIFEILSMGTLSAEFAFNGWQPGIQKRWREVIDVHVGPEGDLERAIVRRMIQLIRTHYTGDFEWESRRLGRVITLSARPEDQAGLEDFLIREFFGTPTVKPSRQ